MVTRCGHYAGEMNQTFIWAAVGCGFLVASACDTASVEPIDGGGFGGTAGNAGETSGGDGGAGFSGGTGGAGGTGADAGGSGAAGTTAGEAGAGGTPDGGSGGAAGETAGSTSGGMAGSGGAAGSGGTGGDPSFPTTWDGSLPSDGICTLQGWCWVYPSVPYFQYTSLAASGPNDTWAVSKGIIHWDGTAWNGVLDDFDGIVGTSSPTDAWLVQEPAHQIRHWNGTTWSAAADLPASGTIRAIWPRTGSDAWLVGDAGAVLHFDGQSWTAVSATDLSHDLKAVHGTGANDVWIGGTTGASGNAVRHYDGSAWTDAPITTDVAALCATSSTEVFTGGAGPILRYNGSAWVKPPMAGNLATDTSQATHCVAAPGGQVYFHGFFGLKTSFLWSGTSLGVGYSTYGGPGGGGIPLAFDSNFLTSNDTSQIVVGTQPSLWRFSGPPTNAFSGVATVPYGESSDQAYEMVPFADDDVLIVASSGTWRGTIGGALTQRSDICSKGTGGIPNSPVCGGHTLSIPTRVFGRAIDDLWAVDEATSYVLHWDGAEWTRSFVGGDISQVVSTTSDAWARSGTQLYRYNGSAIWDVATGAPAADYLQRGIGTEAFAINSGDSSVSHWIGSSWAALPAFPDPGHQPVLCASSHTAGQLKVVTQGGIYDYNGTSWSSKAAPPVVVDTAYGPCGIHDDTVVALAEEGTVIFDGSNWHQSPLYVNPVGTGQHVVVGPGGRAWAIWPQFDVVYEWHPR